MFFWSWFHLLVASCQYLYLITKHERGFWSWFRFFFRAAWHLIRSGSSRAAWRGRRAAVSAGRCKLGVRRIDGVWMQMQSVWHASNVSTYRRLMPVNALQLNNHYLFSFLHSAVKNECRLNCFINPLPFLTCHHFFTIRLIIKTLRFNHDRVHTSRFALTSLIYFQLVTLFAWPSIERFLIFIYGRKKTNFIFNLLYWKKKCFRLK